MAGARGIIRHPKEKKYLLLKRASWDSNPGKWEFPGGGIEDESPSEAILREVEEETGLETELVEKKGVVKVDIGYKKTKSHVFQLKTDKTCIELSDEHSMYKWMNLEDIRNCQKVPGFEKYLEAAELL